MNDPHQHQQQRRHVEDDVDDDAIVRFVAEGGYNSASAHAQESMVAAPQPPVAAGGGRRTTSTVTVDINSSSNDRNESAAAVGASAAPDGQSGGVGGGDGTTTTMMMMMMPAATAAAAASAAEAAAMDVDQQHLYPAMPPLPSTTNIREEGGGEAGVTSQQQQQQQAPALPRPATPNAESNRWTDREKELFDAAFRKHSGGTGPARSWAAVAEEIPGRTAKGCESYYRRVYSKAHPPPAAAAAPPKGSASARGIKSVKAGGDASEDGGQPMQRWTAGEKQIFDDAFARHGGNWMKIAEDIGGGRTAKSCERYYYRAWRKQNPDDATIASKAWSEEEKQKFAVAFAVHGMDWTKVASSLEGRTPRACEQWFYKHYRKANKTEVANIHPGHGQKIRHWSQKEKEAFREAYVEHGDDWDKISEAIGTRQAKSCERYFYRCYRKEFPDEINCKKYSHWKKEEKEIFLRAYAEHGRNWDFISEALETRTPKAVSLYYYKFFKKENPEEADAADESANYSFWTEKEKVAFQKAHGKYGHNWDKVAELVEGRTAKSCERYYYRVVKKEEASNADASADPENSKKYLKWTAEEAKIFHCAFTEFGEKFDEIASFLPGRSASSCERYFYRSYRKQHPASRNSVWDKKHNHWSEEDKKEFAASFAKHGRDWEKIALEVGRTPKAVELWFYKFFKKENPELTAKSSKTTKAARRGKRDKQDSDDDGRPAKRVRSSGSAKAEGELSPRSARSGRGGSALGKAYRDDEERQYPPTPKKHATSHRSPLRSGRKRRG